MKNKNTGFLIIGISIVILIIILIFNQGMTSIVNETCSHGPECGMYKTIKTQTYLSLAIAGLILLIGFFLIFSKENEKIVIKKIKSYENIKPKRFNPKSLEELDNDEKIIMNTLLENQGSIFQSELVNKLNINKVKVTRSLDKLEGRGFIERKRRGMTNIVILKNK